MLSSKVLAMIRYFRGILEDYRRIFGHDPKNDEVILKLTYAEIKQLLAALEVE